MSDMKAYERALDILETYTEEVSLWRRPHTTYLELNSGGVAGFGQDKTEARRAWAARAREERAAAGLCQLCGREPGERGLARCASCRIKRLIADRRRAAAKALRKERG